MPTVNIDIHTNKIVIERVERIGTYGKYSIIRITSIDRKESVSEISLFVSDDNNIKVLNNLEVENKEV